MCKHTRTELKPLLLTTTQHAVVACHANADTGSKASCPGLFECDMAEATAIRIKQPIKVGLGRGGVTVRSLSAVSRMKLCCQCSVCG